MTTPRRPVLKLALPPALRAALPRLAARLGLASETALLVALVGVLLDREGVEAVPPAAPWRSGPRLDEEGDRERVGVVLDRGARGRARRLPVKRSASVA